MDELKARYRHRSTFEPDEVDRITTEFDDTGLTYRVSELWYGDGDEPTLETKLSLVTVGDDLSPWEMNTVSLQNLSTLPVSSPDLDSDLNEWALLKPDERHE